ncbi:ABC transporter related protein [Methanolacinia petrolearia DSM 11571]|uniref:ABC transporter related protein n=1 Tax=Methanolacinia petrolearia (strain DSM 11571 / OCM 486 / SEBR 4847) TaxID=679926 RepID=E1REZ2_METP4|nr:ABC transporter ATP-binding protein [Methanolacinia petrolearia]ADN36163.1 ABC transporter related protein [Methanolacinia petrolearia DSM 11571]
MITVKNVSKKYRIYHSPADRLKEIVTRKKYHKDLQALSGISFSVADGETLGIVGENGAGKSTLLKILQGVVIPDEGEVEVTGKVTGLLELGTGFNHELTGIENIYMNGTLLGMSKDEIDSKRDEIINFTELGDAINDPIKTYSSGMLMRLGFSIAIHADPACFLVDEALSVGDAYFQQKCMRAIQAFKEKGGSIIFVSHDMNAVKTLCDAAIFLEKGSMVNFGNTKEVVDLYLNVILQKSHQGDLPVNIQEKKTEKKYNMNYSETSTGEVELVSFKVFNEKGNEISYIESENVIRVVYEIKPLRDFDEPHYGLMIRNTFGVSIFETNTYCMNVETEKIQKDQNVKVEWLMNLPLSPGAYSFSVGVANKGFDRGSFEEYSLLAHDVEVVTILLNDESIVYGGLLNLKPSICILNKD